MIRILLLTAGFLGITMALLLSQLDLGGRPEAPLETVTRADTQLAQPAPVLAPAPKLPVVAAPSSGNTADRLKQILAQAPGGSKDDGAMRSLTSSVLTGLREHEEASAPAAPVPSDEMRNMTAGILSRIHSHETAIAHPDAGDHNGLEALIARSLHAGHEDSYIDALVNAAADRGDFAVPAALRTAGGKVDTRGILSGIVQKSTGGPVAKPVVGGDGVEVRVVQKADGTSDKYHFYTVSNGDSLGGIAMRFYGDAGYYTVIFEANRARIASPDSIRVGQRLVIPKL